MNAHALRAVLASLVLTSLPFVQPVSAAVVTTCNDFELRVAVAAGGTVTFGCGGVITLTNEIRVTSNTTLDGTSATVTIDGASLHRLFVVDAGVQFTIRGLTLANGRSSRGGALLNNGGNVSIRDCVFTNNIAAGSPGQDGAAGTNAPPEAPGTGPWRGGDGSDGEPGQPAQGGAIASFGLLSISNTVFIGNTAAGGAGGRGGDGGSYASAWSESQAGGGGRGGAGGSAAGGALYASGIISVADSKFMRQVCASGNGGGGGNKGNSIYSAVYSTSAPGVGAPGGSASGGAIFSLGTLMMSNCVFSSNLTRAGIGGFGGSAPPTVSPSVPGSHGTNAAEGGSAFGGAVYTAGGSIAHTLLSSNQCVGGAGGAGGAGGNEYNISRGGPGGDAGIGGSAFGGAILVTGDVALVRCELNGNWCRGGLGGTNGLGGWRNGRSGLAGKGGDAEGGAVSVVAGTVNVSRSTISQNHIVGGLGGVGVHNLNSWNNAGRGGVASGAGLANRGRLIVDTSTVQQNTATGGGGGKQGWASWLTYPTPTADGALGGDSFGAGIFNAGVLGFDQSLLLSNYALGGAGGDGRDAAGARFVSGGSGAPGGSAFGGGLFSSAVGLITNSTIGLNTAQGGVGGNGGNAGWQPSYDCFSLHGGDGGAGGSGFGAGLLLNNPSNYLRHVTIAYNAALAGDGGIGTIGFTNCDGTRPDGTFGADGATFGGGVYAGVSGVTVEHVILAYNTGGNVQGSLNDIGVNLTSDSSHGFSSGLNNIDPLLGVPADHGGPTKTMPLLSGSPAIDKIPPGTGSALDQRGAARPAGAASDIGAYEADRTLYMIHGRVTAGGVGVRGVSVTTSNFTAYTDAQGYYRLGGLLPGGYTVTPFFAHSTLDPASRSIVVSSNVLGAVFAITNVSMAGWRSFDPAESWWLQGLPDRQYIIEASETLTNWTPVITNTAMGDGRIRVVDVATNQVPYRFYRARPLP